MTIIEPREADDKWAGHGIEVGTNDRVTIFGKDQDDVELKANGRAYRVKLIQLWELPQ